MGPKSYKNKNLCFWIPVKKNKIHVAPKEKRSKTIATFQKAVRATLAVGQVMSLIPVYGVLSDDANKVKFVKMSWKFFYAILSFLGQIYMFLMCTYQLIVKTSLKASSTLIFYGTSMTTMAMFLQVAKNWPMLVQHIYRTEELDPSFDSKLTHRCNVTSAIMLSLALLEHILSYLSAFAGAIVCEQNQMNVYESFAKYFYPWVFNYLPYNRFMGIISQLVHFQSTFIWSYSDVFIITISHYLTSRLQEINKKLVAAQGKYLPEIFWRTTRESYGRTTQLVKKVDDVISGIIFVSFANNLFFICLQLFNTLEDGIKGTADCKNRILTSTSKTQLLSGYEIPTYFLFSLVFVITRSIAVSLIAAQINTASTIPAPVLYDVPSPVYCIESLFSSFGELSAIIFPTMRSPVQRFLDQVNGDKVALTGLQFFSVTRGLLLTVAGTIVTYELVMVQFNSPTTPVLIQRNATTITSIASTTPLP